MSRSFIRLGDRTSHGGQVLTASSLTRLDGRYVSRKTDKVSCPIHGDNEIVEGDTTTIIDGQPVALDRHKCACGAELIASQSTTNVA